jgi:hypothetical protein
MGKLNLGNIFTYHKPFGTQAGRYEILRNKAREFAETVENLCPDSREKSLAITNIQQSIMWANASIAINEVEEASVTETPITEARPE